MRSTVAALLVAACSGASSPPASPERPTASSGRAERVEVAGLEAYALEDGHLGDPSFPQTGRLPASLAAAGVDPAEVTDVFISHVHGDHVGGLVTRDGALAFPEARIRMTAPEWEAAQAYPDEESQRFVAAIASNVTTFEPGATVLPMVQAVDTRGHTPGHSSYVVGAGGQSLFYLGDLAHHAVISMQRLAWPIQVDSDHAAAAAVRQQTLATLAAERDKVFVPHFPYPGVGYVVAQGDGFAWSTEPP